ncbi:hypothetical protein CT0861_13019, partial [Colletotrichum tofieldiae]
LILLSPSPRSLSKPATHYRKRRSSLASATCQFPLHAPYPPIQQIDNEWNSRRLRHARGCLCDLHILLHLDPTHALCRRRPPSPELLPSPRLGNPDSRHSHPPRFRRRRLLPGHCHDPEQQEEGRQGQGCREEEGVKHDKEREGCYKDCSPRSRNQILSQSEVWNGRNINDACLGVMGLCAYKSTEMGI